MLTQTTQRLAAFLDNEKWSLFISQTIKKQHVLNIFHPLFFQFMHFMAQKQPSCWSYLKLSVILACFLPYVYTSHAQKPVYNKWEHLLLVCYSLQISYAIGVSHPLSISVFHYGTSNRDEDELLQIVQKNFDLRPGVIVKYVVFHSYV